VGHFALASDAYAHFTSPIRRYPDLTVHRALAEYLKLTENGKRPPTDDAGRAKLGEKLRESTMCPDDAELAAVGRHCTNTEANASDAEEDLKSFLVLQLLTEHIGESFRGMVTGCKNVGIFVQLEKFLAEGMIKKEDLPAPATRDGRMVAGGWRFDPRSGSMLHQSSGQSYSIGDQVSVTIAAIDLALRRMELVIADPEARERGKGKSKQYPKRGSAGSPGPNGPTGLGVGGGTLNLDWEQIKHGTSGAARRSQKSKARDKGKGNHRRDA
jgi:ribonuclease R